MQTAPNTLATKNELAHQMCISLRSVENFTERGILKAERIAARTVRYDVRANVGHLKMHFGVKANMDKPILPQPVVGGTALLDKDGLAAALKVSTRTIEGWQLAQRLPHIALSKHCIRYINPWQAWHTPEDNLVASVAGTSAEEVLRTLLANASKPVLLRTTIRWMASGVQYELGPSPNQMVALSFSNHTLFGTLTDTLTNGRMLCLGIPSERAAYPFLERAISSVGMRLNWASI